MTRKPYPVRSSSLPIPNLEKEGSDTEDSHEPSNPEDSDSSSKSYSTSNRASRKDKAFPRHSSDSRLTNDILIPRIRSFVGVDNSSLNPKPKRPRLTDDPDYKSGSKVFPVNGHAISASRPLLSDSLTGVTDSKSLFDFPLSELAGLDAQIQAVSEAIMLPLKYPGVCAKLGIKASRGFLFHGPPGTGKTSVARALATEFSDPSKPLAYFQFSSSDILSKNVGESEAKLAGIFEAAKRWQPSVIFFDEVDGLIPSRIDSDRPSASLVSTFLHLMDGMVSSGDIIVIGSTNRLDSIDPAMRRPGRFDEELLFPLPNLQGREAILRLATDKWEHKLSPVFLFELAQLTGGFSGADLKALCSRATVHALNRIHPSFLENKSTTVAEICFAIQHEPADFYAALDTIRPSAQHSLPFVSRPLSAPAADLLLPIVEAVLESLTKQEPYQHGTLSMPQVIILRGNDTMALQHVLSAVVHRLESSKVVDLDHYSACCITDRSGAGSIQRHLTSLKDNECGVFLIRNAHMYFEECSTKVSLVIKSALKTPCIPGQIFFLATARANKHEFPELGLVSQQTFVNVDKVTPNALDGFCKTFLEASLMKSSAKSLVSIPKKLRSGSVYCSSKPQSSPTFKLSEIDPEGLSQAKSIMSRMLKDMSPSKVFEAASDISFDNLYNFVDFVDCYGPKANRK